MKSLTIAFITSRAEPKFEWFVDSLSRQVRSEKLELIVVSSYLQHTENPLYFSACMQDFPATTITVPKPSIWQGQHRITKQDWWAKSNALNTAICLCRTEWIAFVDDRCVLGNKWIEAVKRAMDGNYAVCGAYEKRINMSVNNGKIVHTGTVIGKDPRLGRKSYHLTASYDWFGCTNALPLEWALKVNGYPEDYCDGMRYEDTTFGRLLANNKFPIHYDQEMMVIEDRTPGLIGPDIRGEDWGKSPMDASHKLVELFDAAKDSKNSFNLRAMRDSVQAGNPFPLPTAAHTHWFTGKPIMEFI